MRIENYISELLYQYQCVTIPGFGAFLTNYKSAEVKVNTYAFYPPLKLVSFNAQLINNDGLLAKHIASKENIPYEDVLLKLEEIVENWQRLLREKRKVIIKNIGELWLNEASKIQFLPDNQVNYLSSSFGLSSFVSRRISREVLKEEVEKMEENAPLLFTPEKRRSIPYMRYAAIAVLAISMGLVGFKLYKDNSNKELKLVDQQAQDQVEEAIQQATFFSNSPKVLPAIKLDIKKEVQRHKIIGGAFRISENADKKVAQLKAKGYKEAQRIGKNKYGLHQVIYASYENPREALVALRKIKALESPDVWLLSE